MHNYVLRLLKEDDSLTFYINLFWKKSEIGFSDELKLTDMYTVTINFTLITIGGKMQEENIVSE